MLNILICDDDVRMLNAIQEGAESTLSEMAVTAKIYSFSDASQVSAPILSSCDIALLDIDFDSANYNGMDIARKLRSVRKDSIIIFVTNFIEYAPAGYEVQAFRYILKKELCKDLAPYLRLAVEKLQESKETFKIQVAGEIIDLPLENILYLEVQQHNVTVHVQKEQTVKPYTIYTSLSNLEQELTPHGFLRVHKSYLVNMRHLKKFQCREATLDNGMTIRVSEKSYAEKKKQYLLWKGWM